MGPISYNLNVPDPSQTLMQGFQQGLAINQLQAQQAQAEAQARAQQQMQAELAAVAANPQASGADYARLMTRYPQLSEQLKRASEVMTADQQQAALSQSSQVYSALRSGRVDVAKQLLLDRAEAAKNSGDPRREKVARAMAEQIDVDPGAVALGLGVQIAALPGGDKVIDGVAKLGVEARNEAMFPAEKRKAEAGATEAEAKAVSAGVAAKFAESQALADLEKRGWDIKALQADIEYKKQSTRIAAMNAALAREGNDLKREELRQKLLDAQRARDDKVREKVATAEAGANSIDNMLNTVERIKGNKSLGDVVGSIEGRLPAMVTSGMDDEESDAIALIETLGSQAFLAQIPNIKGMGALSNAEGEKLQSALQNLGRAQSEKQFRANLDEASRLLKKGRESIARSTGVPLNKPDTPAAPGARPSLDSFFK